MSKSSPDDLVVAFRSFNRRRAESVAAAEGASVSGLLGESDRHLAAAAALLGVPADAGAIADGIAARRTDDWDDATLDALREHATAVGLALRRVAEAGGNADDER